MDEVLAGLLGVFLGVGAVLGSVVVILIVGWLITRTRKGGR